MTQEILSVAVWEPVPDMEVASLATLRELTSIVTAKGYGRDLLYRDREAHYVFLRYWKSEEARQRRARRSRHAALLGTPGK